MVLGPGQLGRVRLSQPQPGPDTRLLALVLKLLKMATGMRALLDTVVQALPQVGARLTQGCGRALQTPPRRQGLLIGRQAGRHLHLR